MPPHISSHAPVISTHRVTITYLEQISRGALPHVPRPAVQCALMQARDVPASFYRYLFDAVGAPHKWVSRRYLTDEELHSLILQDTSRIFVVYKDGWPAGFAETDDTHKRGTEIKFFGLVPEAQGFGIGPWFFHEVAAMCWDRNPTSLVIETCTLDNPAALRLYQRLGFAPYDQAEGIVEWRG